MSRISHVHLLDPEFRHRLERVLDQVEATGLKLRLFETIRSPGRQMALYSRGRDPEAADFGRTVTKARAYQSAHQYGLAADLVFYVNGEWTWSPPNPGDWDVFHGIARVEGLVPLSFEKPHVQIQEFDWKKLERGPDHEAGWLQWLRVRNGPDVA
jgi:peptidoglycan LD-endopeptidase CwlK